MIPDTSDNLPLDNLPNQAPDPAERTPQMIQGRRAVSMAALRERIETEFLAEARPDMLLSAADDAERRDMIREVADYILEIETIRLSRAEKGALLDALYATLFRFGALDPYLQDESISEMTIDGPDRVYVRHGAEDMQAAETHFEDADQLARIVQRVLSTAGTQFSEATPFIEVGTLIAGRPARLTVAAPPISPLLHVDVRLHPAQALTLDRLIAREMLSQADADTLITDLQANRGLMIVGDVGTGKTTLLQTLLPTLPAHSIIVERSAEMRVPLDMERMTGSDFAAQIEAALAKRPPWLVLDEVRFDEAHAIWSALNMPQSPRCLWTFRGATDPMRLRAAFSMSIRRAQPSIEQSVIYAALVDHLPRVVLLARREAALRVIRLGEWRHDGDSVTLL